LKARTIAEIISRERGYVNDPNDSGGETMDGITVATARRHGYSGPMRDMPEQVKWDIYQSEFWYGLRLDDVETLSPKLAEVLADIGVNMGTVRAGQFLQRALNVLNRGGRDFSDIDVDGAIGPMTLSALRNYADRRFPDKGEAVLCMAIMGLKAAFYVELCERRPKDERFAYGWLRNRVVPFTSMA
ncbi:MAG: glycoside hydrolase family 108 protein, partial [Rhodospirillaceae bacterium]